MPASNTHTHTYICSIIHNNYLYIYIYIYIYCHREICELHIECDILLLLYSTGNNKILPRACSDLKDRMHTLQKSPYANSLLVIYIEVHGKVFIRSELVELRVFGTCAQVVCNNGDISMVI